MRLSTSLTLWLIGLIVLVLGVHTWTQLANEEAALLSESRRELTLIATAIRNSVENAVRDGQEADLESLLEEVELKDPSFDVFVFGSKGELIESSWGSSAKISLARTLAADHLNLHHVRFDPKAAPDLAVVAPFRSEGAIAGQVVILRPPSAIRADLRQERNAALASIVALVAALSLAIWIVIHLRLQRPITRIISVVHRVAAGDLSARIRPTGSDELAMLASEVDKMVEALEGTRARLTHEESTRERLEGEMLRANRLAIVGQLAATLAHEVGSPLQVLFGRAGDISARSELPDDVRRSASIIEGQVERINEIVERFLNVARRKSPMMREVDLSRALHEVTELVSAQYRHKGVAIALQSASVTILADPAQLQQVFLNLLQNALRASPSETTVRIEVAAGSFQRLPDGPYLPSVAVAIEDEGPGVTDQPEVLFDPFFSGWESESEQTPGTGLGLSVVRTIMTDHHGVVRVERATRGAGARFVVHFPAPHNSSREEHRA